VISLSKTKLAKAFNIYRTNTPPLFK